MDNRFIWANSDNKKDEHVDFLDFFTVKTSDGLKCSLEISVSGDYIAYVNGERVGEQFSYDSTGKLTIHKTEAGKNRPVIMHILGN